MQDPFPKFKVAIVAPVHIQPTEEWIQSLFAISKNKNEVRVIIVDDSDGKVKLPEHFDVFGYERQRQEMGDDLYARFEMFHKSSSCKSFGIWLAWRDKADIIIVIDSDCVVPPGFIGKHIEGLMKTVPGWTNPIKNTGWFSRGFPMSQRALPVAISMGLWNNELDLYGYDRVQHGTPPSEPGHTEPHAVADGIVPLSGMNVAFWARCAPALCFLPNFDYDAPDLAITVNADQTEATATPSKHTYRFRRHDDIWGGYIFQTLMAKAGERLVYGDPVVFHDTVVVPEEDAAEEMDAIAFEEDFYNQIDMLMGEVQSREYDEMFNDFVAIVLSKWKDSEWEPLMHALHFWSDLFSN